MEHGLSLSHSPARVKTYSHSRNVRGDIEAEPVDVVHSMAGGPTNNHNNSNNNNNVISSDSSQRRVTADDSNSSSNTREISIRTSAGAGGGDRGDGGMLSPATALQTRLKHAKAAFTVMRESHA